MKCNFLTIVFPVAALLLSCGGNQTKEKDVVADTTVVRDTVVQTVIQPVDTAAIIAAYEAEYAKTKSKNAKPVYKAKAKKQVTAYPEPEIQSVAPAKDTVDIAGYNYKADKNASYPGGRQPLRNTSIKILNIPTRLLKTISREQYMPKFLLVKKEL
jgi:hypothetical protein